MVLSGRFVWISLGIKYINGWENHHVSSWKYCFEVLQCFDMFDTLPVFGSVDGERWKSEVYEEQRCLQRRLLQLHSVSGLCQCGKMRIHLIIASSISSVYSLIFELYLFLQTKLKHPSYQAMAKTSLQLAVQFLFHTYLRTKKKLRWDAISFTMLNSSSSCYYC